MKVILTIAGYDPSSGAGITKDLDVFFSLGIHGLSVPTATVAQGPRGVEAVYPTPEEQFRKMLEMAGKGISINGVKIGVMWDGARCTETASFLKERRGIPVVVDPVTAAKNDMPLVTEEGARQLMESIFPLASVVTPNIVEASAITGRVVDDVEGMKEAARAIRHMGPRAVVVKGGHLRGEPMDLLFDGKEFTFFEKKRIDRQVHGTGCMFSSALTSFLVLGYSLKDAFFAAQEFMKIMLTESYRIDEDGYYYGSSGILNRTNADRFKTTPEN